ncbi:MAG: hypothetical protein BWY56_02326 [Acidobacteria bacterium ADurb.Bin340]|nr:MAG: hypothetical protein BWY56_02326 [Acidobacteria bacterium ADurb.Bin340]
MGGQAFLFRQGLQEALPHPQQPVDRGHPEAPPAIRRQTAIQPPAADHRMLHAPKTVAMGILDEEPLAIQHPEPTFPVFRHAVGLPPQSIPEAPRLGGLAAPPEFHAPLGPRHHHAAGLRGPGHHPGPGPCWDPLEAAPRGLPEQALPSLGNPEATVAIPGHPEKRSFGKPFPRPQHLEPHHPPGPLGATDPHAARRIGPQAGDDVRREPFRTAQVEESGSIEPVEPQIGPDPEEALPILGQRVDGQGSQALLDAVAPEDRPSRESGHGRQRLEQHKGSGQDASKHPLEGHGSPFWGHESLKQGGRIFPVGPQVLQGRRGLRSPFHRAGGSGVLGPAQGLGEAGLPGTRRPGQLHHQAVFALLKDREGRLHLLEVREGIHPMGARPQFPRRLRPPQQQFAQHRRLLFRQVEALLEAVFVLRGAAARLLHHPHQALRPERLQRVQHGGFLQPQHGIPVAALVAARHQGVQRERVVLGGAHLLLQQHPEHPHLDLVEGWQRHGGLP